MAVELVAIGASWGGLDAVERLLGALPPTSAPPSSSRSTAGRTATATGSPSC